MSYQLLLNVGPVIQIHIVSALTALILGPVIFLGPKGTPRHKRLGKTWGVAMAVAIVSSMFIYGIRMVGVFSPIHLLSLLGAWLLIRGINHARNKRTIAHETSMRRLYFWSLGVATVFTFWPGRMMSRVIFPEHPMNGFYFVSAVFLTIYIVLIVKRTRQA